MKIEFRLKNSKKAIFQNSMKTTFLLENFEKLLTWSPENLTKEINLKRLLVGDIYKEKRTTQWNKNRAITERHYQLCSKLNSSIPITAFVSRATPTEHTNPLKLRLLHFFLPLHFSLSLCFFLSLSLSLSKNYGNIPSASLSHSLTIWECFMGGWMPLSALYITVA